MTATAQLILVGVFVAVASLYVARSSWKVWFGKSAKGCGAVCGKCVNTVPEEKQEGRFPLPQA